MLPLTKLRKAELPVCSLREEVKYSFNKLQLNTAVKETNGLFQLKPGGDQSSEYKFKKKEEKSLFFSRKYNPRNEAFEIAAHL